MNIFADFFPLIMFFLAYKFIGIYGATYAIIAGTILQVVYFKIKKQPIAKMQLITALIAIILGFATIYLKDERFIKWKPTMVFWVSSVFFIGSHFVGDKLLVERMLSTALKLPKNIWKRLNIVWIIFFFLMGFLNLYVAFTFSLDIWVDYKIFGSTGIMFMFILLQSVYASRYVIEDNIDASIKQEVTKENS